MQIVLMHDIASKPRICDESNSFGEEMMMMTPYHCNQASSTAAEV